MLTASTRPNIKSRSTQHLSRPKKVAKTSATFVSSKSSPNKQSIKKLIVTTNQKFGHENKQQVKYNNKNYNSSCSAKIRYNEKVEDFSNSTSATTCISNANSKVSTLWNEDYVIYVEPSTYQSTIQSDTNQSASYSSTSTQSSCACDHYNGSKQASSTTEGRMICEQDENVKNEMSQCWVTSLYDIYLVTQKFNPSENIHQNYLDTVRYAILAIWGTPYDSEFHYWMQQVLQMSGTNCRIIELSLYYLLRFKRCLNRTKIELSYIVNYSRFTVSTEPCPKSRESIKPLPALISSLILAWKFFQDENFKTNYWTFFTGYTIEQLNVFERDFLRIIDYNVFIKENSFKQWLRFLHSHMQAICGPGLDVKFAYFLPQNQARINEFIKSLKMLNIEEMERIIKVNERYIGLGKENEKVQILNLEDIKRIMKNYSL